MYLEDTDVPAPANRKLTFDGPKKKRHGTIHPDNALDQISNQSNTHKPKTL